MAKQRTTHFCKNCGFESVKWIGRCPSCAEWNTFMEEVIDTNKKSDVVAFSNFSKNAPAKRIQEILFERDQKLQIDDSELNRVLGGGLVLGSLVLVGGEPGIGKSTLLLQLAVKQTGYKVLYVSGEESESQIKMRSERIGVVNENCFLLNETNVQSIISQAQAISPDYVIVDSIQTLFSSNIDSVTGTVSQIRECTALLLRFAKESGTPVFLIGHVTKDGTIAGPKLLEHMVDTVIQFEGDQNHMYRILRSLKNRFGNTNEIGIYEMTQEGLMPILNPSEVLVSDSDESLSGVAIGCMMDGNRPILIEVQALVSTAAYGTPQRTANGFDTKRLNMILAVLEKRCGFRLASKDVFLNIAGGIRVDDPALDLAVVAAILSSNIDVAIEHKTVLCGEVALTGEIRSITKLDQRITEAIKLGYKQILTPISKKNGDFNSNEIRHIPIPTILNLAKSLFK
ncbi:MAG: DNA repair protein RadA [Crocinitomicaceae bacterium]|nr:DNA repair protein RadA [Crocinitomicaceae bacterium]MCF8409840.1 DNA repair protein RadA [Crocinitomicaceae bacterium]MCF8444349.1 DNA repair protein RadA [Crocinitomicaceae bacterium]